MKNEKVWKIAMTGVFAALSYVVFTFLQFKIWHVTLPGIKSTIMILQRVLTMLIRESWVPPPP